MRLDIPEATAAMWRRADMEADRRAAAAHTPLDLIADIDRQHRELRAILSRTTDLALAKGDTRTVIELARERRHLERAASDHAARRGAYGTPHIADTNVAPDSESDDGLGEMQELMRFMLSEASDEVKSGASPADVRGLFQSVSDALSGNPKEPDGDDPGPAPVHVTA